jgi:hypothetical protein
MYKWWSNYPQQIEFYQTNHLSDQVLSSSQSQLSLLHHAYLPHHLPNPGDSLLYRIRASRMLRWGRVRVLEHRSRPTWKAGQGDLQPLEMRGWLYPRRLPVLRGPEMQRLLLQLR